VDTAGIRLARDEAESIGIRKSMEALAEADLVLVVIDQTQDLTREGLSREDTELLSQVGGRPVIVVANKADLMGGGLSAAARQLLSERESISTSALTGEGIGELREAILRHVGGELAVQAEGGMLTNVRHRKLVDLALTALDGAKNAVAGRVPHEMLLLDLYGALRPLDEITGATTTDDILNLIFGTFCIGK
jgi:tRNA modification GTPase